MSKLPSIIKPADVPKLVGPAPKSQDGKARKYDELRPGVNIPDAQKAERFERMKFRENDEFGSARTKVSGGKRSGSSMLVPELPWLKDK